MLHDRPGERGRAAAGHPQRDHRRLAAARGAALGGAEAVPGEADEERLEARGVVDRQQQERRVREAAGAAAPPRHRRAAPRREAGVREGLRIEGIEAELRGERAARGGDLAPSRQRARVAASAASSVTARAVSGRTTAAASFAGT